VEETNLALI